MRKTAYWLTCRAFRPALVKSFTFFIPRLSCMRCSSLVPVTPRGSRQDYADHRAGCQGQSDLDMLRQGTADRPGFLEQLHLFTLSCVSMLLPLPLERQWLQTESAYPAKGCGTTSCLQLLASALPSHGVSPVDAVLRFARTVTIIVHLRSVRITRSRGPEWASRIGLYWLFTARPMVISRLEDSNPGAGRDGDESMVV
jgi:hypothetical protein